MRRVNEKKTDKGIRESRCRQFSRLVRCIRRVGVMYRAREKKKEDQRLGIRQNARGRSGTKDYQARGSDEVLQLIRAEQGQSKGALCYRKRQITSSRVRIEFVMEG